MSLISVCICTYQRPELLRKLLYHLIKQKTESTFDYEVIVIDDDKKASARPVVDVIKHGTDIPITYHYLGCKNIAKARNKAVELSKGDFIAFIDDDEYPEHEWLLHLYRLAQQKKADGVLGPVLSYSDMTLPGWLVKSGLLERERFNTGTSILREKYTRTGNVLLKKELFLDEHDFFDEELGECGGEDVDFFRRMLAKKKRFYWANEAVVYEFVPPNRLTLGYHLKRALLRGEVNAKLSSFFSLGTLKSLLAVSVYPIFIIISPMFGYHNTTKFLIKFCDHLGKMYGMFGLKIIHKR